MLEKFWEYLKHSIKVAWKSVFYNFKQYAWFFLAVLLVEILYGMVAVSTQNGNMAEYKRIKDEYEYHIVLKELNDDQARYVINYGSSQFKSDQFYETVNYEKYENAVTGQVLYDVFLKFNQGSAEKCLRRFENTYQKKLAKLGSKGSSYLKELSPLMRYSEIVRSNNTSFLLLSLLLLVLCVFLLTSLYRIRINHYKFEYGIYLTFGADFKMLFNTAFWELFVIFVVTFIPSVAISGVLSYLLYSNLSYGFSFTLGAVISMFIFTVLTIVAAVWGPMRMMSLKQPMSLIIAEDNSNLVSSPRSSVSIFGEKFPRKYEFYSLWRFRRYNIQVLTTAIVFCAMFIMGLNLSVVYKTNLYCPRPQYTASLSDTGYVYDEYMSEELYAIPGVRAVEASDNSVEALDVASHVLVKKSDVMPLRSTVAYDGKFFDEGGENWVASNSFLYKAMSDEQLSLLEYYDYSGDLNCIHDDGYVIVADANSNLKAYRFEVGDKIQIAVKTGQYRPIESNESGNVLLRSQLRFFKFEYREYTVGAVIHNIPCKSTPIYLPTEDYESITGLAPDAKTIDIFAEDDLSSEELKTMFADIREWAHSYGSIVIADNDEALERHASEDRNYGKLFIIVSILILLISPLVWFFSQTLYYSKREKEFNILQALGAISSEIREICLQGGLTMAFLSLVVSIALSFIGSYILYLFVNVILPIFSGDSVRFSFYMPWYAIVISVVVSVACGFLSTYLPYRSYYKHRFSLQNGGAGEEYGADE